VKKILYFFIFIKPYRFILFNTIGVIIIATIINLIPPWIVKILIDDILPYQDIKLLNIIVIVQLFVVFNHKILISIYNFFLTYLEQKLTIDISKHLFNHLFSLPIPFFNCNDVGGLVHRFTNDVMVIRSLLAKLIIQIFVNGIILLFLLIILFYINIKLAFICLGIALIYGINANIFKNRIYSLAKDIGEKNSALYGILYQVIPGIREIKGLRLKKFASKMYLDGLIDLFRAAIKNFKLSVKVSIIADIFPPIAWVVIIAIGGREVIKGNLSIGGLLAFSAYLDRIYEPINGLSGIYSGIQSTIPAMERIEKILREPKEFAESKGEKIKLDKIKGELEFRCVNFGYIKNKSVLKNINLIIKPGSKVAIVGSSGCGKSTLVNLIVRFYDVSSGSIYLDNINIRKILPDDLRKHIGIVSQGVQLFPTTIKENIRMGNKEATDMEIMEAAKMANAHDFIENLSNGYNTLYGDKGILLSGGEGQRIVLARAILQNTKILILDEATAFIDANSEFLINDAIKKIRADKTMIVIAHKFSSIIDADWIYAINDGMIVEEGKHQDLIKKQGVYANLFQRQLFEQNL
jgi:ABC-type bacteriocin/lantibiotic exporter with double-glycine peptidase domain